MALKSLSYSEYEGSGEYWKFESCVFSSINLIVGKNSTGKSRLISILSAFCDILNLRRKDIYQEGKFSAEVEIDNKNYSVKISFADGKVVHESLSVDGDEVLIRDADGKGKIYYVQEDSKIGFQIANNALALQQKQDVMQHPFLAKLAEWAAGAVTYYFNKSFSNNTAVILSNLLNGPRNVFVGDGADVVRSYSKAYESFGRDFDNAVIADMKLLGYNLSEFHAEDIRRHLNGLEISEPLIGFVAYDSDIGIGIPQTKMSQGMYRALSLVIEMNIVSFAREKTIIFIDDIGEGLDFERSVVLLDIIIKHAKNSNCQIFMTTNDRFVMNHIPLEYWIILQRKKSIVSSFTERTNREEFDDFKYMGLSNFDFFSSANFSEK